MLYDLSICKANIFKIFYKWTQITKSPLNSTAIFEVQRTKIFVRPLYRRQFFSQKTKGWSNQMAKRGENIYKRKDGRWEARVLRGYSESGKALYSYFYGRTYKEAKDKIFMVLPYLCSIPSHTSFRTVSTSSSNTTRRYFAGHMTTK